ncbi:ABC-type multidrug transport system ATPase subunit [Anoxybacillus calidus]|uniref:ABC-type multidrug transport system ATPase subunit n=1 Tax=[Anoxybacillus] calidus TaxID=575178 RepID=A0A7W0BWJ9_9BACL|nr:ABC-type multidrug transport system ATPase subunit [Anoxybacillus calidus]
MCDRAVIIQNGKHIKTYNITEKSAQEEITFIVDDVEKAVQVLMEEFEEEKIRVKDRALSILMKEEDIPSVVKALVSNNIDLYYIHRSKQSLEDIFLEATGGNIIE